jgi:hypothetical protein
MPDRPSCPRCGVADWSVPVELREPCYIRFDADDTAGFADGPGPRIYLQHAAATLQSQGPAFCTSCGFEPTPSNTTFPSVNGPLLRERLMQEALDRRHAESQQGERIIPDRWSLSSAAPAATDSEHEPAADQQPSGGEPASDQPRATEPEGPTTQAVGGTASEGSAQSADQAAGPRRRPGELRALVHAYLAERPGQELTATKIGKELGRSAGAVGNALATMTDAGEVVQTSAKPRNYMVVSQPSGGIAQTEPAKTS